MEKSGLKATLLDLAHEIDVLFPHGHEGISNMEQGGRLRDEKIEDLRKANGTLQEGYDSILKDLEQIRDRRHILIEYYKEVKNIVEETTAISQTEQEEFLVGAKQYIADLESKRYTILIAGETSAGKSSLINLLLNDNALPTCITQSTYTICEISYGPTKEAVIHFFDTSKLPRILDESKFDKIKKYIAKPVQNEPWCQRIEIKIPNLLLKGGVVIVDSPGISHSEQINKITMEYLPQACAFIYVLNTSNAGGLQEDRLPRMLREWIKLYNGEQCCGITAQSALFVCNKWDEVEKQANQTQREDLQKHIIGKLRNYILDLDESSQLIRMSVLRAAEVQKRFHVMSDDLKCLIDRLQRLLPLCIKRETDHLYNWISAQLSNLSHQVKCAIRNAKLNRQERLKVREQLTVKLEKLKQGILIQEIEDAISNHVRNLCERITSYMKSDEVRRRFCTWEENDLPCINDRQETDATKIRETYSRYIEERFLSYIYKWELNEQLLAKAYEDLDRRLYQGFYDLEKDIRDIDWILIGESTDETVPCETPPTNIFLVMSLGIFMPVLIPVGLAAGVLFAPVFGYLVIDKHLKERQLMNNRSQALTELSAKFLEASIDDQVLHHVQHSFSDQMIRITRVKGCHQKLIASYEQRCKDLTSNEDDSRDKETLKKNVPLCEKLQEMNENLTFDGIQSGMQVMNPPCQINIKSVRYDKSEILGAGSYGTVFKGKFTPPRHRIKDVAVKELKEAPSPSNLFSFLHEAATVKQLKHKHIVTFYGLAIDVKDRKLLSLLLVFDLCTGSLKSHIFKNDDRIPCKTPNAAVYALQWTKQILDALAFIHSKNIVHRDLKLDNILISKHDNIKVADLGLAKFKERITGTVCGTVRYMAPEVHEGKPYCTMADMYSFGLMMWEMWFGKGVFFELRHLSRDQFLRRIKEDYRPQIPRTEGRFYPNLPPAKWTELMTSCWQTESSLRKTAAESKDFVKEIEHQ